MIFSVEEMGQMATDDVYARNGDQNIFMKKKLVSISLSLIMILMLLLSGCGMGIGKRNLVVGVREDVPHFGYRSMTTGRCYGFEIDLADKIADELGYDGVRVVTVNTQNREQVLEDDTVDCVIACYSYSDERAKRVGFSESYATSRFMVIAEESSNIDDLSMLENLTVGIKDGAKGEDELTDLLKRNKVENYEFVYFDSYDDMVLDLEWGNIDAAAIDNNMVYAYWLDGMTPVGDYYYSEDYCVATAKGNPLCKEISEVISELKSSGEMSELYEKWGIDQFGK